MAKGQYRWCRWNRKHAVFRHVQSGCVVINSPQQLAEYTDKLRENDSVIYIPTESMELQDHDEFRQKSLYLRGTLKVHYLYRPVCLHRFCRNEVL